MKPTLLIAGLGNPVLADFVAHAQGRYRLVVVSTSRLCREVKRYAETYPANTFARDGFRSAYQGEVFSLVVFLGRRLTTTEQNLLDTLAEIARQQPAIRVGVISTFRVHCGDGAAARVEAYLRNRLQSIGVKALLFRPGHVLSGRSRVRQWLRSLAFCHPLVPERFQSCFLTGDELFCVLERELEDPKPRPSRTFTLLGRNRSWKAILRENQNRSLGQRVLTAAAMVLSLLQVGRVLGLFFDLLARVVPRLRAWNFDTLIPRGPR
ncbi:MAG: hypothetical protein JO112_10565, partial [Planctomycetes bacterium]|nr:hypothetical protein [Planctomycetota bacterium]